MTYATVKLASTMFGLATALAPCGVDTGGSGGGSTPPPPPPPATDAGAPTGCAPAASISPGQSRRTLRWSGGETDFELHIPPSFAPGAPLVIELHGYTESPSRQNSRSDFRDKSDEEGFVLAQPYGAGSSWNGGACCGSGASSDRDDIAFLRSLISGLASTACIDRSRVYVTGFSNGGFMAHRLACEAADIVTAIAPVAGVVGIDFDECRPSRPVPVMHTHGTADPIVPWGGSAIWGYPEVQDTVSLWRNRNACGSETTTWSSGNITCEEWSCQAGSDVTLCTVSGGGHSWPSSATDAIWDFFQQH